MNARRYRGLILLGAEGVAGFDRGASRGDGLGAQLGARLPFYLHQARFNLDLLLGARPFQGMMGEARLRYDARISPSNRPSAIVWGLWGVELTAMQGATVWHSLIELPRAHLGYRSVSRYNGLEVGVRAGWSLLGRYNPQDATRPLGNRFTPGFYFLAHTRHLFATWEARSFTTLQGNQPPVLLGDGLLCAAHRSVALCLNGRLFHGDVRPDDGSEAHAATSWQFGLMLGFGERADVHWD